MSVRRGVVGVGVGVGVEQELLHTLDWLVGPEDRARAWSRRGVISASHSPVTAVQRLSRQRAHIRLYLQLFTSHLASTNAVKRPRSFRTRTTANFGVQESAPLICSPFRTYASVSG